MSGLSHHCAACDKNWWPYETQDGRCPTCGGGTRRVHEPGDSGRVRMRRSNAQQPTVPIDVLEVWWNLPAVEPKRELRFGRNGTAAS